MKRMATVMTLLGSIAIQAIVAYADDPQKPAPASPPETGRLGSTGQIDDSIVNRLAIGMSDTEVLMIAGPPKSPLGANIVPEHWIYLVGDQVLQVSFSAGRIVKIERFRSQAPH